MAVNRKRVLDYKETPLFKGMIEDELRKHVDSSVASAPVAMFLKKRGICDASDIVTTSTLRDILDLLTKASSQ